MARNGNEIADSDGESDVDVAPSPPLSQLLPKTDLGQTVPDIDLGVNFSDFLSQSQTHDVNGTQQSVRQEDHPQGIEKSTGTTASLQRQIESEQRKLAEQKSSSSTRLSDIKKRSKSSSSDSPIVAKTKRRHSELGTTSLMEDGQESRRKRQHTYGSSSSRLRSSQGDIFTEEHRPHFETSLAEVNSSRGLEHSSHQPEDNGRTTHQQTELLPEVDQHHIGGYHNAINEEVALQGQDSVQANHDSGPSGNDDTFEEYMQMSSGRISKSRSLMGNYESINLDYSHSGLGLNVNANPFGDVSQESVEDITDRTEQGRLEAISHSSKASTIDTVPFPSNRDSIAHNALYPHISGTDGASSLREDSYTRIGSDRSRSFVDPSVLTKNPAHDTQERHDSKSSSSRKRRETADGFALNVAFTAHDTDISPMLLAVAEKTPPPRIETQGKKRGRKPKIQNVEPHEGHRSEHSERQNEKESVESPAKHASSELHSDDDSTVDLPKEQYKPRPSRSRSKRNAEEEMPPPTQSPSKSIRTPIKQPQTSQLDDTGQPDEPEDTPLTKLKKEKKMKNKMKRAKTSAAALLKKSDRMLSDGEEDVMWVDTKPATVKMKLPDPLEVKDESLKNEKVPLEDSEVGPARAAEISVNIPVAEEEPHKQPPKKRGRKKKTVAEMPAASEIDDDSNNITNASAEAEEAAAVGDEAPLNQPRSKASTVREALREKDVNTSHTATSHPTNEDTSTPQETKASKDTHTSSAGREKSPGKQQPPPPTPPQSKSNSSSDKGPTKHSPINPTGGKVKYRVGLSRRAAIPPLLKMVRK